MKLAQAPHGAKLSEQLGRSNILSLPSVDRIVVNVGVGRRVVAEGKKSIEPILKDIARITGQKPSIRPARKSIASFKLREGLPVGVVVTLRGKRAQDFLYRLVHFVLPRTRDFRGIGMSSLDAAGNLSIGIREQTIFPEVTVDPTGFTFGLEITIVTRGKNRDEAEAFFRLMKFPLQTEKK